MRKPEFHGHSANGKRSATYMTWAAMKSRCYITTDTSYKHYGAKGIIVCERWKNSFNNFLADMGEKPEGLSLERKNRKGNYCPENCCWATREEQMNNHSTNVVLSFNGETRTATQWAKHFGWHKITVLRRLWNGWTVERALTQQPILSRRNKLAKPQTI